PTTILGLNKKVNHILTSIDARFKYIEKKINQALLTNSEHFANFEQRFDQADKRANDIEFLLLEIRNSIKLSVHGNSGSYETKTVKTEVPQSSSKGKSKEAPELSTRKTVRFDKEDLIKRNKQGRLELSDPIEGLDNLSPSDMFVRKAWPEAIFPNDVDNENFTSVKNKVVLKPEWQLKIANEMSGDFHSVRVWSIGKRPTWILLLEAIFTTMQRLNVLHSPLTKFSLLSPSKEESPHSFAWRLRDAYYQLSGTDRNSDAIC
ncbi:hypothetical protein GcC1_075032, partial [Golovinomyces cichoracearum]